MFEQNVKESVSFGHHNLHPHMKRGKDTLMKNDNVVKLQGPEEVTQKHLAAHVDQFDIICLFIFLKFGPVK